jgi:hypothetical protein
VNLGLRCTATYHLMGEPAFQSLRRVECRRRGDAKEGPQGRGLREYNK